MKFTDSCFSQVSSLLIKFLRLSSVSLLIHSILRICIESLIDQEIILLKLILELTWGSKFYNKAHIYIKFVQLK